MAEAAEVVVFSHRYSSCSWRVRLALALKGIPFHIEVVDLRREHQFTPRFNRLNPFSKVPVLAMDGAAIPDSNACLEFLEERFPDRRPLLPRDLRQRAAVRAAVAVVVSGIQPFQNGRLLLEVEAREGEEAKLAWARRYVQEGFAALERMVAESAGRFCFGDEVTLADVVLVPQVYNARSFDVDMGKFPTLRRISDALFQLPEVQATAPDKHPGDP